MDEQIQKGLLLNSAWRFGKWLPAYLEYSFWEDLCDVPPPISSIDGGPSYMTLVKMSGVKTEPPIYFSPRKVLSHTVHS